MVRDITMYASYLGSKSGNTTLVAEFGVASEILSYYTTKCNQRHQIPHNAMAIVKKSQK
jgi:hypothetical protein